MRKRGEFIESGNTVMSGQLCYIISAYSVCILCVCVDAKTRWPGWKVCVCYYKYVIIIMLNVISIIIFISNIYMRMNITIFYEFYL